MIRRFLPALGAAAVTAAVALVYREAIGSYFVDDDFHWLQRGRRFEWLGLLQLALRPLLPPCHRDLFRGGDPLAEEAFCASGVTVAVTDAAR